MRFTDEKIWIVRFDEDQRSMVTIDVHLLTDARTQRVIARDAIDAIMAAWLNLQKEEPMAKLEQVRCSVEQRGRLFIADNVTIENQPGDDARQR